LGSDGAEPPGTREFLVGDGSEIEVNFNGPSVDGLLMHQIKPRSSRWSSVARLFAAILLPGVVLLDTARAEWPDVFDPFRILTLNLQMDSGDWSTVRNDSSLSVEVPAAMWADGESAISVRVRRKAGGALTSGGVTKVALKIDINDLVPGQTWRGLKKLSLENGAEISTLREGLMWNMFRLVSDGGVSGYPLGHASWVRVIVNGEYQGVYVNAEQRDKQFLENRGLYKEGATWLYKVDGNATLEAGITASNSPTYTHLCYTPFTAGPGSGGVECPQPNLESDLPQWVDMQALLSLAAVNAFCGNGDSLVTHDNKNSYAADFLPPTELKRLYFPWDLDTGLSSTTFNIYTGPRGVTEFQEQIIGHYWWRQVYRHVMQDMVNGPLSVASLTAFLDQLEPVLGPALDEDPNAQNDFSDVRSWVTARVANVRQQLGTVLSRPRIDWLACEVVPGAQAILSHTNASGTIYFTVDGTDPRAFGGSVAGSAYSAPLALTNTTHIRARVRDGTNWSALAEATFNAAGHASGLKMTEIMYHPRDLGTNKDGKEYEFIELKNTGALPINLSGYFFEGIDFEFAPGTVIAPGAFVVLVRNAVAFASRYPGVAYHGIYLAGLNKDGEKLRLKNSDGNNIISVEYNDGIPWPLAADGFGWSLVNANPNGNPDDPRNWRASAAVDGSPGAGDPAPPYVVGVVINEVLGHSDSPLEDAIELFNPTTNTVNISGWFLSDDIGDTNGQNATLLKKFQIPNGTTVGPGEFKVFYEADFNAATSPTRFGLSKTGEEVFLASADANGNLTGYIVGADFDAEDTGISFGRVSTSEGVEFVALAEHSFGVSNPANKTEFRTGTGGANSGPSIGPIVINEIMYNPTSNGTEFVELHNLTTSNVDLSGWLMEGTAYTFPPGTAIAAQGFLVLVGSSNVTPAAFRASHNVPAEVPVLSHAFDLQNDGESLRLRKQNPDAGDPAILVDRVRYNNSAPWPVEADGTGLSLERFPSNGFGNEPLNWRTANLGGSPGRTNTFSNQVVVAHGSSWKHHHLGCDLGTAWRSATYTDSSWHSDRAPLGYGQPFLRSILTNRPGTSRPITTYFRKEFVVNDAPGALASLILKVNYDDGFVAWLNGAEVARRSLPGGAVTSDSLASSHEAGGFETVDITAHKGLLATGANVLAIEVHQQSLNDSDLVWDAELSYTTSSVQSPRLLIDGWDSLSGTALRLEATPGQPFIIQYSHDLLLWTDVTNVTGAALPVPAQDAGATNTTHRFYRAVTP
jgi:hypothetical protein